MTCSYGDYELLDERCNIALNGNFNEYKKKQLLFRKNETPQILDVLIGGILV